MKTLLIVDDHPIVLEGICSLLGRKGYRIVGAASKDEALKAVRSGKRIDLMVIDVSLAGAFDGLDLLAELRTLGIDAPAIVYTMHGELWNVRRLQESGAQGIVLKGDSIDELTEAIRKVEAGGTYLSAAFAERTDAVRSAVGIMTGKEIDMLKLISAGTSTHDIARRMCITDKAVEYHRSNILKKLGSNNMTQAIHQAVKLGILTFFTAVATFPSHSAEPQPIDLGLSVKWADRNLGAQSPLEAGGYYAFAELSEKEYYDWSTYEHCADGDMSDQRDLGEESICGTQYDAARVILGDDWRMPTAEELIELMEACQADYFLTEPLRHVRFTAAGGAYIDIPMAGYMSLDRVVFENIIMTIASGSFNVEEGEEDGFYWYMNGPYYLGTQIKSDASDWISEPIVGEINPTLGLQIRPVYCGGTSSTKMIEATGREIKEVYTIDGRRLSHPDTDSSHGVNIVVYTDGTTAKIAR